MMTKTIRHTKPDIMDSFDTLSMVPKLRKEDFSLASFSNVLNEVSFNETEFNSGIAVHLPSPLEVQNAELNNW